MSSRVNSFETIIEGAAAKKPAPEGEEKSERFFGYVTGIQDRAHNLELRKAAGPWPFIEYSYLTGGEQVHAGEFLLRFATGERVTVRGRHLRPLYEKLLRHRVTWLREAEEDERGPADELCIDEIEGPVKEEG
jgi:hypothetical protein